MQRSIRAVVNSGRFNRHSPGMANRIPLMPGNWTDFDPFLMMAEDQFSVPGGFPDHPHRGIQTVTLMLDGALRHADNRGNSGVLTAGDVQFMTAGRGIIHAELPQPDSAVHSLQLWVNLPASRKMMPSSYRDLRVGDAPVAGEGGSRIRVVSGDVEGVNAPVQPEAPIQFLDVVVEAGKQAAVPVPASHNGFIYVLEGVAQFGSGATAGHPGDVLWLNLPVKSNERTPLAVRAETYTRFIVVSGEPIREPVVAYGPFVMNSMDEIAQAYADYRAGRFGGPTPAALEVR